MADYGTELQGSFNVVSKDHLELQGSLNVEQSFTLLVFQVNAVSSEAISYSDLDEYAVEKGYADAAAMLVDLGYSTELEFAQSQGRTSVSAFLSSVSYPSLKDIFQEIGVEFV